MLSTLVTIITWATVIFLGIVTVLLMMKKKTGLKMIQHELEMLPQAMLVRYGAAVLLALIASWMGAPKVQFAMFLMISVVGFGDAYIYRRAGYPFWSHVAVGALALVAALLALLSIGGSA